VYRVRAGRRFPVARKRVQYALQFGGCSVPEIIGPPAQNQGRARRQLGRDIGKAHRPLNIWPSRIFSAGVIAESPALVTLSLNMARVISASVA
jgi:hypothetical protein